jgi:hypothetical protein
MPSIGEHVFHERSGEASAPPLRQCSSPAPDLGSESAIEDVVASCS